MYLKKKKKKHLNYILFLPYVITLEEFRNIFYLKSFKKLARGNQKVINMHDNKRLSAHFLNNPRPLSLTHKSLT